MKPEDTTRRFRRAWLAVAALSISSGCDLPRDPEGTLDRVRGGTLRVGVSIDEPWTTWRGSWSDGEPGGVEVRLVRRFADEVRAQVHFTHGSESELLSSLEKRELDLVVGGLMDDTLWSDRVGLSRAYVETAEGKHVLAVLPGENEFLLRLDRFLANQEEEIRRELQQAGAVPAEATTK